MDVTDFPETLPEIAPKPEVGQRTRFLRVVEACRRAISRAVLPNTPYRVEEADTRRRVILIHIVSGVAVLNLVPLGVVAYFQGKPLLGVLDHVVALLLLLSLVYVRRGGRYEIAAYGGIGLGGALFLYLFLTGGVQNTGHFWLYTFPLFACFLLGSRRGALASLGLVLPVLVFLIVDTSSVPGLHQYSSVFAIRFVPSYLVVLAYAYAFERLRAGAYGKLEQRVRERTADLNRANVELLNEIAVRRQAEAELQRSHNRFTTVLDSIEANVYTADLETKEILFANHRMREAFGADVIGHPCWKVVRGRDGPCEGCRTEGLLDDDGHPRGVFTYEGRNQRNGLWYLHQDRAIRWVDGRYVRLQVATNITKRRHAEEENARLQHELLQAQKMEAIGTLAGGVAHDLNNILAGIMGYPDLLLMDLPQDSELRKPIEAMKGSAEKCKHVVQDMLTLASPGGARPERVSLDGLISEFLKSPEFERLRRRHPKVVIDYEPSLDSTEVSGTPHQLSKTLLNLVVNAFEATPDGGRVRLAARRRRIEHPLRGYTTVPAGDYVTLTIEDTGIGIPPEHLSRIFEPFFTTKVLGTSGSGLGMAVVWATVQDHGGYLDLRSQEARGTAFEVFFPAVDPAQPEDEVPVPPTDVRGRGETILVVDDVEEQREIASMILRRLGYAVDSVAGGEDAIDYVRARSPDLMVIDMIMDPGIDGLETYQRALAIRPNQRALIVSGYAPSDRVEEALSLGASGYVHKPYLIQEIGSAIRTALA